MLCEIAKDFPNDIIYDEHVPCISLYQPTYQEKIKNLTDSVETANANFLGSDDLAQVIKALLHTE